MVKRVAFIEPRVKTRGFPYTKNCRHHGRQFFYTIYRPVSVLRMPINPEEYLVRHHPENTSILLHFWIIAFAMCPNYAFIN